MLKKRFPRGRQPHFERLEQRRLFVADPAWEVLPNLGFEWSVDMLASIESAGSWEPRADAISRDFELLLADGGQHNPLSVLRAVNGITDGGAAEGGIVSRLSFSTRPGSVTDSSVVIANSYSRSVQVQTADFSSSIALEAMYVADHPVSEAHVRVEDASKASIELEVTDPAGNPVSEVHVGQEIVVDIYAHDLSDDARGIFCAFSDIEFDSDLAIVVGNIRHSADFQWMKSGEITERGLNNVGGIYTDLFNPPGARRLLVASFTLRATSAGIMQIQNVAAGEYPLYDTLVYGKNVPVDPSAIEYGSVTIHILSEPAAIASASSLPFVQPHQASSLADSVRGEQVQADSFEELREAIVHQHIFETTDDFRLYAFPLRVVSDDSDTEMESLAQAVTKVWASRLLVPPPLT